MDFSTRTPLHQSDALSSIIRSLMSGASNQQSSSLNFGSTSGNDSNLLALVRELAHRKEEEERQNKLQQQLALLASLLAPEVRQQQQQERERDVAHVLLRQLGLEPEPHARQTQGASDSAMAALLMGCNNGALTGATVSVSDGGSSSVGSGITSGSGTKSEQKTASPKASTSNVSRRGRTAVFPQTLYQVLQDLEDQGKSNIASFTDDGKAFRIHSPKKFEEQIVPHYFPKMANYASFQRQLNLYDFIRVAEGPAQGSYAHELFVKGEPIQASKIVRTKIKGKSKAALKRRIASKADV